MVGQPWAINKDLNFFCKVYYYNIIEPRHDNNVYHFQNTLYELRHDKTNKMTAPNEDSDQPVCSMSS